MAETLYSGIDVSMAGNTCCSLLEDGTEARRHFTVPNNLPGAEQLGKETLNLMEDYHLDLPFAGLEATDFCWWHLACFLNSSAPGFPRSTLRSLCCGTTSSTSAKPVTFTQGGERAAWYQGPASQTAPLSATYVLLSTPLCLKADTIFVLRSSFTRAYRTRREKLLPKDTTCSGVKVQSPKLDISPQDFVSFTLRTNSIIL